MSQPKPKSEEAGAPVGDQVVKLIPALRAFARTFTLDVNDADDLVQETLMRALRSIDTFRPDTSLKSWLFTIMRNTYCTQYRKKVREAPGSLECVSSTLSVAAVQEWKVVAGELHAALAALSEEQRQILILVAGLGFSYEEAAEVFDCAVGTIKSRLNRAREALALQMHGNPLKT